MPVGVWVMVFWLLGRERVVVFWGTDRTLRTTQWTRASIVGVIAPCFGVVACFYGLNICIFWV